MIKSFPCRDTEKLSNDKRVRRFQSFERFKGKKTIVCKLSINDALTFFEEGLIEHFKHNAEI